MLLIETLVMCAIFFALCFLGTGTDHKNLKNYSTYPDEVKKKVQEIEEYKGRFKETSKNRNFVANLVVFLVIFIIFGIFIRQRDFIQNFKSLFIMGQVLNIFDLVVIDLIWWRNTKRIRFTKIPDKSLYQDSKPHIDSFVRALIMYTIVAAVDGYILTMF